MGISLSKVSFFAFVFVIGIFNIWYLLEMMQVIPRIPFKILSSGIFLYIFTLYFTKDLRHNLNLVTMTMGLFVSYLVVYNIIHYFNYIIVDPLISNKILYDNLGYIYAYVVYFFIGFYYKGFSDYRKIIYLLYVIMTVNALLFVDISTLRLDMGKANLDLFGIYLFLGDTYAIFSILTIIVTRHKVVQFFLFLISLAALYILMSRTSLYVFTLTIAIYILVTNKKSFLIFFSLFFFMVFVAFIVNPELMEKLINSRMLGFLFGNVDLSVNARSEFLLTGLNGISDHWFLGDFGGEAIFYNQTGTYIHSYLGLLRQYGVGVFMIFIVLILFLLKEIYLWLKYANIYTRDYHVFIGIAIFTLVEIIMARAIYFSYIFFTIGVVANLYKDRNWIYKAKNV